MSNVVEYPLTYAVIAKVGHETTFSLAPSQCQRTETDCPIKINENGLDVNEGCTVGIGWSSFYS